MLPPSEEWLKKQAELESSAESISVGGLAVELGLYKKEEYILCAAIWFDDGEKHIHQPKNIETGLVLCGWRHHCIFPQMGGLFHSMPTVKERIEKGIKETQGFITNTNRFVDRIEAAKIAFEAKQIKEPLKYLKSEDIY